MKHLIKTTEIYLFVSLEDNNNTMTLNINKIIQIMNDVKELEDTK